MNEIIAPRMSKWGRKGNSSKLDLQKQDKVLTGSASWSVTDHPGRAATERNKDTFHPTGFQTIIHDSTLGGKPDAVKHDPSPEWE